MRELRHETGDSSRGTPQISASPDRSFSLGAAALPPTAPACRSLERGICHPPPSRNAVDGELGLTRGRRSGLTIRAPQRKNGAGVGDVVLLDEHPIWLDGLEGALVATGVHVVAKVTCPQAALDVVDAEAPAGLVASLDLPSSPFDGIACLRASKERARALRVVALSAQHDGSHLNAALAAGADAYLAKTAET